MDLLPCPGCRTMLAPEATGCHICLRARTKQEIVRGYSALREEKTRRRKFPLHIAAVLILAGAGGKIVWDRRASLRDAAEAARHATENAKNALTDPRTLGAAPAVTRDTMQSQIDAARSDASSPAAPAPAPAAAPAPAPRKTAPGKNEWRVSGTVYDLATLEPVPGAEIAFRRDGAEPVITRSGDGGAYEADLLKGPGWTVSARAPGHRDGQVLEVDPPYRQRDEEERHKAIENLSEGDLSPAPVEAPRSGSRVALDIVVVPEHWTPRR